MSTARNIAAVTMICGLGRKFGSLRLLVLVLVLVLILVLVIPERKKRIKIRNR